jgi:hypothetical protein
MSLKRELILWKTFQYGKVIGNNAVIGRSLLDSNAKKLALSSGMSVGDPFPSESWPGLPLQRMAGGARTGWHSESALLPHRPARK